MRAANLLRAGSSYRCDAFSAGLARAGYEVSSKHLRNPSPNDLLLIWNRSRGFEAIAQTYEAAGATVLIAENGYIGQPRGGGKWYALARNKHNGAGSWRVGDSPRFMPELKPWREAGEHVLILPQRGIGSRGVAMPDHWPRTIMKRLSELTGRPLRMRRHPGASKADPWPDLEGAHCAVTWGSGAGVKAIAAGVPVFHEMPEWIGSKASLPLSRNLEECYVGDRNEMFHHLSWAQWTLDEIGSGDAFTWLLDANNSRVSSAGERPIMPGRQCLVEGPGPDWHGS